MKKLYFYLTISFLILLGGCKKENECKSQDKKYQYREISTHNVTGITIINPCDAAKKSAYYASCPPGWEVIWN